MEAIVAADGHTTYSAWAVDLQKRVLEITKKYDPLKICTIEEMRKPQIPHSTEISYKKNMHNFHESLEKNASTKKFH